MVNFELVIVLQLLIDGDHATIDGMRTRYERMCNAHRRWCNKWFATPTNDDEFNLFAQKWSGQNRTGRTGSAATVCCILSAIFHYMYSMFYFMVNRKVSQVTCQVHVAMSLWGGWVEHMQSLIGLNTAWHGCGHLLTTISHHLSWHTVVIRYSLCTA